MIVLQAASFLMFLAACAALYGARTVADSWRDFWNKDDRPAIVLVSLVGLNGLIRTFI